MVRKTAIGLLALAAILMGALAAGSPTASDGNRLVVTAGHEIGTPASASTPRIQAPAADPLVLGSVLRILLRVLLAASVLLFLVDQVTTRPLLRRLPTSRRGPPCPA